MSVKQIAMAAAGVSGGGVQPVYIEDVFSTWLYTGNGGVQNINNGIPLASTAEWWGVKARESGSSIGRGVSTDSSGNVYVTGNANDGSNYAFIAKYNSSGVIQWQRKFRQNASIGRGIATDSSGNVYVTGRANDGSNYAFIAKYNTNGTIQWQRKFREGATQSDGNGISTDSSGNVYVTGFAVDTTGYAFVVKYNTSGTLQWQRKLRQADSTGSAISTDSSGNVYVIGWDLDSSNYAFIAKYNTSGTLQWQRRFREAGSAYGYGISTDSSGNVYVTGYADDGSFYAFVIKYNTSGTLQWQRKFRQGNSLGYGIATDSSGSVYITGYGNDGSLYSFISKYNTSGTLQWQRKFREGTSVGFAIATDSSSNVYVAGYANDGNDYLFLLKLAQDGSTASGTVNNGTLTEGTATDSAGTATDSAGTATDSAGTATDSAGTATDSAGTATSTTSTQASVAGKGGAVFFGGRNVGTNKAVYDTARGATFEMLTNVAQQQFARSTALTGFTASGFTLGADAVTEAVNKSGTTYASWTFAEQAKFFDVVTWTGNGASNRNIAHSLGSVPGCIIIKRTDSTGNWIVGHRGASGTEYQSTILRLNTTDASFVNSAFSAVWTSSAFQISAGGGSDDVNANGATYVAYLFAHNAGGFGLSGTENVISCGSFTTDGSGNATVNLGYEPQWVMTKQSSGTSEWRMFDNMRGMTVAGQNDALLQAQSSAAEINNSDYCSPTANGFGIAGHNGSATHIYIAIRRGPMRVPTNGAQVFYPQTVAQTNRPDSTGVPFPPDLVNAFSRNGTDRTSTFDNFLFVDRLRSLGTPSDTFSSATGGRGLISSSTGAEWSGSAVYVQLKADGQNITRDNGWNSSVYGDWIYYFMRRAPQFFDVVCYTGTGSARTVNHNLGVAPELMIVKGRNTTLSWFAYASPLGATNTVNLDSTFASYASTVWNNAAPTSSVFSLGTQQAVNGSGDTYVAYLFASCPGVSKVGSYTGNGSSQTIDCGFAAGARFVLIKATSTSGDWRIFDTARGIVAGNDPVFMLNSTSAESSASDTIDPASSGFVINQDANWQLNTSGVTYLFLAIA